MRAFLLALQFLTRIPTPQIHAEASDHAASIRWFPAVGMVVGAIVAGSVLIGAPIDPWTAALLGTVAWVAITGALHLDGLADLADAIGAAHRDRDRLLAVMADPHVGGFGVVAIVLQLLAKLVLLHGALVGGMVNALPLVPLVARMGPLVWARALPPLHAGMASRLSQSVRRRDLIAWGAVLIGVIPLVPALLVAPLLIGGWTLWLKRRLGGVSGDCHGAGIEIVETGLLLALCVAGRA
ncbi:adenosylcobinamide-GDP ribazoletransferase [Sphingomonas bacterium]|uniref:adenosylcobinamide-GDP ribazoletransferase n=1 Tax=Sphingomonas bacterium TaxID=1895847 RepID=UPI001575EA8F|nr:adenosylcobinamide-GDP ribazoletransferase [Sphingomonas bacterium]